MGFLVEALDLADDTRVLDVGCGPGRHVAALHAQGIPVVGADIAHDFLTIAAGSGGSFVRADARRLPFPPVFDAVVSLCQGGFGLTGEDDGAVLAQMAGAVRPGGKVAFTAFSSYFAVRFLEDSDRFDAATGVNHELAPVRDEEGRERTFDLWTSCFTPRELHLLCERAGLVVEHLWSVAPGRYGPNPPDLDHPEFLVVATR